MSIVSAALKALRSTADRAIFPTAADGITLLVPTDAAFTTAFASSGLTSAEIGDKVILNRLFVAGNLLMVQSEHPSALRVLI